MSPFSNASIQIAHSSLEKYRLAGRLCFLLFRLGPALSVEEDSGGWAGRVGEKDGLVSVKGGRSGGEEMIEGWIGDGGLVCDGSASVGSFKISLWESCTSCSSVSRLLSPPSGLGLPGPSDESSSFSQTISGVQTRSGRLRTTIAGARSASRWLERHRR